MSDQCLEMQELTRRMYELISAPSAHRDWESIRALYHPRATLVRTGIETNGKPFVLVMSYDEYIANATSLLDGVTFREIELKQDVCVFGNVARLASVYKYELKGGDSDRSGMGVNFFNLINEGDGWRIMNIVWDNERDGVSLQAAGLL